jgi:hypothetical protein
MDTRWASRDVNLYREGLFAMDTRWRRFKGSSSCIKQYIPSQHNKLRISNFQRLEEEEEAAASSGADCRVQRLARGISKNWCD